MSPLTFILFVLGLGLLISGAELLVRGASRLAVSVGISPLVVGLTVVAFGTSSPELAVSVKAAFDGVSDIAMGNVVGSNIVNILVVLGISAMVAPLTVQRQIVVRDVPLMIIASLALFPMGMDGSIDRMDGAVLVVGLLAWTFYTIRESRREDKAGEPPVHLDEELAQPVPHTAKAVLAQVGLIVVGFGMLVLGAKWLVDGATVLARAMGVSDLVIGLTIVALGTSLPEVAISAVASYKGERDIAVGNAVGSNLFNILAVLGIASLVAPEGIAVAPSALSFDLPVMTAVAVVCLPVFFMGNALMRGEGALFFAAYIAYVIWLVLESTGHPAAVAYGTAMTYFVAPITGITILIFTWRHITVTRRADGQGEDA